MDDPAAPLRLRLESNALVANWRWLKEQGGDAACGAAIKADGYGLGARAVMERLAKAGCRDFYVATWAEAAALMPLPDTVSLSVLHGVREEDMPLAMRINARPVLDSMEQVRRWVSACPGKPCDLMIDTGMNRLGIAPSDAQDDLVQGLNVAVMMSHLACADEDSPINARQLADFKAVAANFPAALKSLSNSAGICLGSDYAFDLTRPGIALYGGIPRREAADHIRPVVQPEAQILQIRTVRKSESIGYGATFVADRDIRIATIHMGYADGIFRMLGPHLSATFDGTPCAVIGRVSMDLIAVAVPDHAGESDWIALDYDLAQLAGGAGLSQYELLTGLGSRWARIWS